MNEKGIKPKIMERRSSKKNLHGFGEQHWSKVLQTTNLGSRRGSNPAQLSSPPITPISSFGQSVNKFFKWITPSRRSSRKNSLDSERKFSISSKDCFSSNTTRQSHTQLRRSRASYSGTESPPTTSHASAVMANSNSYNSVLQAIAQKHSQRIVCANQYSSSTSEHLPLPKENMNVLNLPLSNHMPLSESRSCPYSVNRDICRSNDGQGKVTLAATWPPADYEFSLDLVDDDSVFGDDEESNSFLESKNTTDIQHLHELVIPFENLKLDLCIQRGENSQLYRGRCYGDVIIQMFDGDHEGSAAEFWKEVRKLSRIRHENISLFMGACTAPPNLAVIIGLCNGPSLYEKIHIKRERMSMPARLNIAYQVAQGLSYLHAKSILCKHLNSSNIFIEQQKAKLSVVDFSNIHMGLKTEHQPTRSPVPYLAPELLEEVTNSCETKSLPHTLATDIYAYGISLFELMFNTLPFGGIPAQALIRQVCQGRRPQIVHMNLPLTLKKLMEQCWGCEPKTRPSCHDIVKDLQKKDVIITLHKRHSASEPERLNKFREC